MNYDLYEFTLLYYLVLVLLDALVLLDCVRKRRPRQKVVFLSLKINFQFKLMIF